MEQVNKYCRNSSKQFLIIQNAMGMDRLINADLITDFMCYTSDGALYLEISCVGDGSNGMVFHLGQPVVQDESRKTHLCGEIGFTIGYKLSGENSLIWIADIVKRCVEEAVKAEKKAGTRNGRSKR